MMNKSSLLAALAIATFSPSALADAPQAPVGKWLAEDIRGGGVIDRLQTTLEIRGDGQVSGTGGCNRYTGHATIEGASIKFGPLASTMMACTPAAMDQERKFFDALKEVTGWEIDSTSGRLSLTGTGNKSLVRFADMDR